MPYAVGQVPIYDTFANLPTVGTGLTYVMDTGKFYTWSGSAFVTTEQRQIASITSSATPSVNCDVVEQLNITALGAAITGVTVTGTPTDGQDLDFRIKGDATPRAIAFGASFVGVLLTTTAANKTHMQKCRWDAVAGKWAGYLADSSGY